LYLIALLYCLFEDVLMGLCFVVLKISMATQASQVHGPNGTGIVLVDGAKALAHYPHLRIVRANIVWSKGRYDQLTLIK
jgi:hypothetical protein